MEPNTEIVSRAFDISPDSVYGFLVAALVLTIIFLGWNYFSISKEMISLSRDTAVGMNAAADGLERIDRRLAEVENILLRMEAQGGTLRTKTV